MIDFERYEHPEERIHEQMHCSVATAVMGGIALVGAGTSMFAGQTQADASTQAMNSANKIQQDQFNQTQQNEAPYRDAGTTALNTITGNQANRTGFAAPFTQSSFQSDPGYQFQLNQGNQAVQRSAAAQGGLLSGAAGKAMDQYTTGLANSTYGDAYNRYLQTSNQQYNQLAGVANMGLNATNAQANIGANTANQMANNTVNGITGAANATASGYMGAANALSGGASAIMGYKNNQNILNAIGNQSGYSNANPILPGMNELGNI